VIICPTPSEGGVPTGSHITALVFEFLWQQGGIPVGEEFLWQQGGIPVGEEFLWQQGGIPLATGRNSLASPAEPGRIPGYLFPPSV